MKVDKQQFDALMAKLIATPASAKDEIKKPSAAKRQIRKSRAARLTPRT